MGDGVYTLPPLVLSGYGSSQNWGGAISTYNINHGILYNGIAGMQSAWNRANQPFDRMSWVRSDGPIQYVGGAGDPFGVWEVGGMALSGMSGGKGNYILAALMITRSGNTTGLKMLAAERGILEAETTIAKINSRHYLNSNSIASGKTRAATFAPQNILQEDISAYNAGNFSKIGNDVSINGRMYGVKNEGATLFPRSGGALEFIDLTQGQIKAIQLMKKVPGGSLNQALKGAGISSADASFAREFIIKH
ncbi:hypothetical protein [Chryseobacterium gregarium]|uniref:hypothetical protein n=1 Tax=Chryseobacterium gregarium TaxID=456299 RepID=UPI0004863935|nr:hypothetical protein [Chryseobacterium gregarium]